MHHATYTYIIKQTVKQLKIVVPVKYNTVNRCLALIAQNCMDILIIRLEESGHGCRLNGIFLGALLYADDVMLISHSVLSMQLMLDICSRFADDYDVKFNSDKSVVMRIGSRHNKVCHDLTLCYGVLKYVHTIKYLGVYINCGVNFKCSLDKAKCKFYSSFNAIYNKVNSYSPLSEVVLMQLVNSYCLPCVYYAIEVIAGNNKIISDLERCINIVIYKIFKVSETDNIEYIRQMFNIEKTAILVSKRIGKFYSSLLNDCKMKYLMLLEEMFR